MKLTRTSFFKVINLIIDIFILGNFTSHSTAHLSRNMTFDIGSVVKETKVALIVGLHILPVFRQRWLVAVFITCDMTSVSYIFLTPWIFRRPEHKYKSVTDKTKVCRSQCIFQTLDLQVSKQSIETLHPFLIELIRSFFTSLFNCITYVY